MLAHFRICRGMRCVLWAGSLLAVLVQAAVPYIEFDGKDGHIYHELDPLSQNIPLLDSQKHLRPPPPRIPTTYDIFIGVSAYRDGVRCGFTLFTAFSRATNPKRVYIGVVDQTMPDDPKCLDEYCKLANAHWKECRYKDQVKIDARHALESMGPNIARYYQQQLVGDQEFCLQVDAHSQLLQDWDTILVKEWARTENEMAVLTNYPLSFRDLSDDGTYTQTDGSHLCDLMERHKVDDIPYMTGIKRIHNSEHPQMSTFFGACLSFSKCHAEKRAPVDKHMKWLFFGEEYLRSYVLWTNGYDLYSPSRHGGVVFHNWTAKAYELLYWKDVPKDREERKWKEEAMSHNRLRAILKLPFHGEVDTTDINVYDQGTVRSTQQFLNFSGVSQVDAKLDEERCMQLHWVPYARPEIIERLLPGWSMYSSSTEKKSTEEEKAAWKDSVEAIQALGAKLEAKDVQRQEEPAWLDSLKEKEDELLKKLDATLREKEDLLLKKLDERNAVMSVSEFTPALVLLVGLALIALVVRGHWSKT
ncbi:unnamed protein product [Aphanomyces euteiches]